MSKLKLTQRNAWPYGFILSLPAGKANSDVNICVELTELSSRDTLATANARPANIVLFEYLTLFAAAPEMYELIECLSQSYDYSKSSHDLASTLYDLRCMALRLLDKIKGSGE